MAVNYVLRTKESKGMATVFARVRSRKLSVDLKVSTNFSVDIEAWNKAHTNAGEMKRYRRARGVEEMWLVLDAIERRLNHLLDAGTKVDIEMATAIVEEEYYREERQQEAETARLEAERQAEENRMTLKKYIAKYRADIASGARLTEKMTRFAPSTVRAINTALNQFDAFCRKQNREYDWDDVDMQMYNDYTVFLQQKTREKDGKQVFDGYSINSIGKCIKTLKQILAAAESEGYNTCIKWKDKKFRGTRVEVDNVYLTREELDKLMALKFTEKHSGHELARDIFMVGCWTAQRVSDYNNIKKEDFETYTKRWIEDAPDPEHPGLTKPEIREKEITVLNVRQQKTGAKVAIPCSTQLKEIMQKYDWQLPHLEDQVINRYLKEICRDAGIVEEVEILETNGGIPKKVRKPKYELVHTHTARRTGATLMYLSGMDIYDIMKITGHTSPVMLKKYIKADELEVVDKITSNYKYFD